MSTTTEEENVYKRHGFSSRKEYLISLADDYSVPADTVFTMASLLGETEDFDGLVSAIQDEADRLEDLDYEMEF